MSRISHWCKQQRNCSPSTWCYWNKQIKNVFKQIDALKYLNSDYNNDNNMIVCFRQLCPYSPIPRQLKMSRISHWCKQQRNCLWQLIQTTEFGNNENLIGNCFRQFHSNVLSLDLFFSPNSLLFVLLSNPNLIFNSVLNVLKYYLLKLIFNSVLNWIQIYKYTDLSSI